MGRVRVAECEQIGSGVVVHDLRVVDHSPSTPQACTHRPSRFDRARRRDPRSGCLSIILSVMSAFGGRSSSTSANRRDA